MAITSEELNFLVYRYLQESGFTHSAFTFSYESFIHKSSINGNDIPPGALISFVQKGLQYLEMEANVNDDTTALEGDFAGFTARDLLTQNIDDLRRTIAERREKREAAQNGPGVSVSPLEVPQECVQMLEGHSAEVYICSWSPTAQQLATGSGDSTARLWDLSGAPDASDQNHILRQVSVTNDKSKDVTTLDWLSDGSILATGSYDGVARIWTKDGELIKSLKGHKGPIFSLKWNRKGDLLLSGSVDRTAIVWDGRTGEVAQQYEFHTAPCLDVDWRNNNTFASCSTDKTIFVCKLGETEPLKRFDGHTDEVNTVKWDPSGKMLASCSDDHSAKIWKLSQDSCVHDLRQHHKEIYTIKWSPTGLPATASSPARPLLATASFDHTIRLWDGEAGVCLACLEAHRQPVYSVAFSPDGLHLASGSFDMELHVWRVSDGARVRTFKGDGGIFEVSWARDGNHVAAAFANKAVAVLDLRMSQL